MLDRVPTGIRIGSEQATSVNLTDLTYPSRFLLTAIDLTISHYIPIVAVLTYPSEFLLTALYVIIPIVDD